jgi:hypothetical protein
MSARDGSKHASDDVSAVGIALCQWERNSHGGLTAGWRRGCRVGSGTPFHGAAPGRARSGVGGDPEHLNPRQLQRHLEAPLVRPPVSARRAERLITAAVIAGLYLIVGLALAITSAGTGPL